MILNSPFISGSLTVTGNTILSGSITSLAGIAGTASYATNAEMLDGLDSTSFTTTSSFNAVSSSFSTRVANTEATASAFIAASGSFSTRTTNAENYIAAINARTGSYATTGSNYFIGTQVITGSVYIANDLIVQGSSSLQNITASAVSIGTNTVILNTDSPAVRFAGISVRDSGSNSSVTSSIWYDSLNNKWIYQNESGSSYSGGMFISGPRNTGSLGSEAGMDSGYIAKGLGGDHIGPSIIFESGSTNIGIGTTSPASLLDVAGDARFGDGNNFNPLIQFAGSGRVQTSPGYSFVGDLDTGMFNPNTGNTLAFTTGGSERIRINSSGNVGIGTTSPIQKFHVFGDSDGAKSRFELYGTGGINEVIQLVNTANYNPNRGVKMGLYVNSGSNSNQLGAEIGAAVSNVTSAYLFLSTTNNGTTSEKVRIAADGNVGIGTTSPSTKFHIYGTDAELGIQIAKNGSDTVGSGPYIALQNLANSRQYIMQLGASNDLLLNYWGGSGYAERMRITSGGSLGLNLTVPTQRLSIRGNQVFTNQDVDGVTNALIAEISSQARGYSNQGANMASIQFRTNPTTWYKGDIAFLTNGTDGTDPNTAATERMRITSGGNTIFKNNSTNYASLTKLVGVNSGTSGNISFDIGSELGVSSSGYVMVEISAIGYGGAGTNGMNYKAIVGGYSGHTVNSNYHKLTEYVSTILSGSVTYYNPNYYTYGVSVTNSGAGAMNVILKLTVTWY